MASSQPPAATNVPPPSESQEDDFATQSAIERSIKDNVDLLSSQHMKAEAVGIKDPSRLTIDDMVNALALRRGIELPLIQDPNGDTWIFIDAPPRQPEQDYPEYENYRRHCSKPHLMKKETLLKMNSSVIRDKLGPTEQFRVLRRRHLMNKLPSHVKYVLDLTPPTEGDEAVWYMSSLCCCEGVRLWYLATVIWKVAPQMVGGEEEYTSFQMPVSANIKKALEGQGSPGLPGLLGKGKNVTRDETFMAAEYTPIRHHMAIERVLLAAQGLDPLLDSAPKFWTTFAVSRYLEITNSPLTDYFVRWLRATPNSNFLDVLPEIAFIVADHLQVHDLARDSFAILVGEEALDSILSSRGPKTTYRNSIFGRRKEDLPETLQTRVQYAAKSFSERIMAEFTALAGDNMSWLEDLPQMELLSKVTQPDMQNMMSILKTMLRKYICTAINAVLCSNYTYLPSANVPLRGGEKLVPRVNLCEVWKILSVEERILTRSFWQCLRGTDLFTGASSLDLAGLCYPRENEQNPRLISTLPKVPWATCMDVPKQVIFKYMRDCRERLRLLCQQVPIRDHMDDKAPDSTDPSAYVGHEASSSYVPQPGVAQFTHSLELPIRTAGPSVPLAHGIQGDEHASLASRQGPETPQHVEAGDQPHLPKSLTQTFSEGMRVMQSEAYCSLTDFDLAIFFHEAQDYIRSIADRMLAYTDAQLREDTHHVDLIRSLVCLNDDDFKYLPLWAGGNDDGSNGVFNDDVPISESGFTTAGPGVHTGSGSSSHTPSDFDMMSTGSESNFNTSTATNAGYSNDLHHARVYATDSIDGSTLADDSATLSSFDMIDDSADDDSTHPAADMDFDEAGDSAQTRTRTKDDEDYGDLFLDDDDEDSDDTMGCAADEDEDDD